MLLTLVSFLFAIGLLVTVHEYGHYRIAKWLGVRVLTFSIGFGKPLLQWRCGETQWQIAAIPLGGFVQMLGESHQALSPSESVHAFDRQHPLRKMAIVAAGPLANLLFAWLLFALAFMVGVDAIKPVVGSVRAGGIVAEAGLRSGDEVTRFAGHEIQSWEDLRLAALAEVGSRTQLTVHGAGGGEHDVMLDLSGFGGKDIGIDILSRLGLSPVPLINRIAQVEPGSAAAQAGLLAGDVVTAVNDHPVMQWERLQSLVAENPGRALRLSVRRGADLLEFTATPSVMLSMEGKVGRLGILPEIDEKRFARLRFTLQLDPLAALQKSGEMVLNLSEITARAMVAMLTGGLSASNVSGPIGIARMAGDSAGLGVAAYLQYLALLSLSLGLLNLLPVPVLDGGHLLYHSAELVRGRPLSASWQMVGQRIGIALLVGLMLLAFYNDIHRFIPG
ncbi:MAG: rseP [Proteobacteria bacterium]|nr:rseP [Pseudomonadota bacterium]